MRDVLFVYQHILLSERKKVIAMAWRPNEQFIEGILDNTTPGKVTGWMRFAGMKDRIIFDLDGDFHRDIRGAKVRLRRDGESANAGTSTP